jgi:CheY-like chemotaxis protein
MPNMNGFELCRQLKKLDTKLKVYFVTAFDIHKGEVKRQVLQYPIIMTTMMIIMTMTDSIIQKPILIDDLVNRLMRELSYQNEQFTRFYLFMY